MPDSRFPEEHLESSELAAYLDGQLGAAECTRVAAHLAACEECRAEAAAVVEVLSPVGHGRRRRWATLLPAGLAAAAAIVLLLSRPFGDAPAGRAEALRSGPEAIGRAGAAQVEVLSPGAEAAVSEDVLFAWRPAGPDALYHIVLTDSAGDVVWQQETRDTVLRLPDTVTLQPRRTYFWHLDALLTDSRTATTSVQRFRTAP